MRHCLQQALHRRHREFPQGRLSGAVLPAAFALAIIAFSTSGQALPLNIQSAPDPTLPPLAHLNAPEVKTPSSPQVFEVAPTPNSDLVAPRLLSDVQRSNFSPKMFNATGTYRGEGFTPGSSTQSTQQAKRLPAPGFSLNVPLN